MPFSALVTLQTIAILGCAQKMGLSDDRIMEIARAGLHFVQLTSQPGLLRMSASQAAGFVLDIKSMVDEEEPRTMIEEWTEAWREHVNGETAHLFRERMFTLWREAMREDAIAKRSPK